MTQQRSDDEIRADLTRFRSDGERLIAGPLARLVDDVAPLLARVSELEQENERLNRRLSPGQGEGYANEVERQRVVIDGLMAAAGDYKARAERAEAALDRMDKQHARVICEALGEQYEPNNRDEWERSFEEMLPYVKARSDAWRALLARIEVVDPEWLDEWRKAAADDPGEPKS